MIRSKKGFTLIELLAVIAIIAILVLIASPRILGYTKDAKLTQIKNDIKAYETAIASEVLDNDKFFDNLKVVNNEDINKYAEEGNLFNKKGVINSESIIGSLFEVDGSKFKVDSKLKGQFFTNEKGLVFYYENKSNSSKEEDSNENSDKDDVYLASDEDFEWVNDSSGYTTINKSSKGFYKYKGEGYKKIEIPETINGDPIKSYYKMFYQGGEHLEKIVSKNRNITDMRWMFSESKAKTLDLSNFDTSNVTDMSWMFNNSKATILDLSSFNTSNVTSMYMMFRESQAKHLNLSNFNTSSVVDMYQMFYDYKTTTLNLSNFDTSNVSDMRFMFAGSQIETLDLSSFNTNNAIDMSYIFDRSKITTGYAKTQEDAERFNTSIGKPSGLEFKLKK